MNIYLHLIFKMCFESIFVSIRNIWAAIFLRKCNVNFIWEEIIFWDVWYCVFSDYSLFGVFGHWRLERKKGVEAVVVVYNFIAWSVLEERESTEEFLRCLVRWVVFKKNNFDLFMCFLVSSVHSSTPFITRHSTSIIPIPITHVAPTEFC